MASSPEGCGFGNCARLPCSDSTSYWEGRTPEMTQEQRQTHEMKDTEDLLASELDKLSMKERSEAYDDVHCVGEELKETPGMIQKSLLEFDEAVRQERNAFYELALNQNRAFVEDPSFRLKFLRANMHNVGKSVRHMMKFLKYKAQYFGQDKLARDITLADLNEEDMELMLSGLFHIQEGRDRMGRVVFYMLSKMMGRFKPETTFRVCYFIRFNILLSLPDVQTKGTVEVYFDNSDPGKNLPLPKRDTLTNLMDATTSIPYRNSATHFCILKAANRSLVMHNFLLAMSVSFLPSYFRARTRVHYGTNMELQYQLRSYGIPIDTFPLDMDGNIRGSIINLWFFNHQEQLRTGVSPWQSHVPGVGENEANRSSPISSVAPPTTVEVPREKFCTTTAFITPSDGDVLSGRGRFFQNHPGNVRFREFVEQHSNEYDKLERHQRMIFTTKLTHILHARNVRFVKQTTRADWVVMDFSEVRSKVSQQFRSIRKRK
mmetsp:Transcript_35772/g.86535  ORF Transcript_35772/g.86535 Transcript_35772/m.86535 type:complete len:489 (+) Transcript_35772:75-1541(+)